MLRQLHIQRGVSLVELMVGLALIGLLLSFGIPSFRIFIQNTQIRNAAEGIQNGLNLARAEAVHRNANTQFVLGPGSAWTVGCVTPVAGCPATIQARTAGEGSSNAAVAATVSTLSFNGFGRVSTVLAAGTNDVFDITNPTIGDCTVVRCLRVIVTQGGQVRMCDPALPSSNPQGC